MSRAYAAAGGESAAADALEDMLDARLDTRLDTHAPAREDGLSH